MRQRSTLRNVSRRCSAQLSGVHDSYSCLIGNEVEIKKIGHRNIDTGTTLILETMTNQLKSYYSICYDVYVTLTAIFTSIIELKAYLYLQTDIKLLNICLQFLTAVILSFMSGWPDIFDDALQEKKNYTRVGNDRQP